MHASLLSIDYLLLLIKQKLIVKRLLNIILFKIKSILYNIDYFDRSFKASTKI